MPSPSEHKLTLADLEAVEKAHERGSRLGTRREFRDYYRQLAANHAVEMKQALAEALEVLESARRYRDHMWRTERPSGWLELHTRLNDFHENWPGLVKK